ncbi:hypothetical protein IQ276_034645 [Desmonostoc muscorum LEGE 12446]|uniref:Effector-associated domain-containing protein n=1 Tax=Desmonostoc muscorum LEGE 12446 TaxID=1828758 RepID=A0A8J6ZTM8_DESMC|nr:hypothetical protein [Desmonostoc muscorum]MCF2151463.1 hypothetical protein [Desmonostoc muscorum LEGE 12446]
MAQVSGKIIQKLLLILTPFMRDKQQRQAYLELALGTNSPVLNLLVWDTSADVFIPQMVNKLVTFGEITSGEPALCALLEVVRANVGLDKQLEIDNLLQRIRQELQQPSLYSPSKLQTEQENVEWQDSINFFLPQLTFIDLDNALPEAVFPNGTQISFNGKIVTPLIPLHPIVLKNFTLEDLINKVHFQSINIGNAPGVRVIIDLPISGIKNNAKHPHKYCIYKDYLLKEENYLPDVPVLEVWPYFRVEGWKEYYVFYYDGEYGEQTFQVSLPDAQEPHIFQNGLGSYQIAHLEEFPSYIICQDSARNIVGLILLKTPEKIQLTETWRIGVDFGTSFSNVYINRNGTVEPLTLQNLHLKVTDVQEDTRSSVLFEYFIPERLIPVEKPFPLANILTLRGKRKVSLENSRPILDARFYIPNRSLFKPEEDWVKNNVNFENLILAKLFLQHLVLHITALAAKKSVSQIQWCLSYPSTISLDDKEKYLHIWQDLTKDLQEKTGIKHICPEIYDLIHFRSQSLAFAQYFADREDHQLVYSTCINIGDRISNISDISIWQNNNLIHQCSIELAVRDLFSQFLELNPKFLERMLKDEYGYWQGLDHNTKLDIFMRWKSENWLKNKRAFIEEESDFQGLLRLTALGFAGLYYYVGTILRVLFDEKKYTINEITPVYMGGNGSQLLHWLAIGGRFDRHSEVNRLLSRMLSRGSSFPNTEKITRLSTRPEDEVACGLVSEVTKLQYLTARTKDPIISGEDCKVNGQLISWRKRLELEVNIEEFHVPEEMLQLRNFLDQFNLALKELEIDGLTPLPDYQPSQGVDANQKLWRDTYKELKRVTLKIKGNPKNIRPEPPFILGLKALMHVLGKEWAGK